jgi:N-acetylglucosamine-6-sulfatase
VRPLEQVLAGKPVWREVFVAREGHTTFSGQRSALHVGAQEQIRRRAAMMASVDEGVGALLEALEHRGVIDDTVVLFLGDNGFFFGEHGLEAERRFAYEEGIRTAFFLRYPRLARAGTGRDEMVLAIDIAPTMIELGGGTPGAQVQGRSLVPLLRGRPRRWRTSFLIEYFNESAFPWLVGMSYKAIRTEREKLIHWIHKDGVDELYDLVEDPYEMTNVIASRPGAARGLRRQLRRLVADAVGL